MKRGHMAIEYKSKIRKLREIRPDISISSDFIIGFPGENDEDFERTMTLINDIGFDKSFSFIYSARPGTPQVVLLMMLPCKLKKIAWHACKKPLTSPLKPSQNQWLAVCKKYWSKTQRKKVMVCLAH